ncbi:dihydrolipoamide acetyltransferase family protein [Streptomyces mirabilis]|uniref:dihydrolipoamide acetyltransferase family protein n=1 Tax=Streptomyces mirabilis TaxID=68239 RepID=UPI00365D7223
MASVREFPLPDLGEGLPSAEIIRWLVAVGDVISMDQPVAEVETAKAVVEVPCPFSGVVTSLFGEPGAEVPVGATLITIAVGSRVPDEGAGSGSVLVGYGTTGSDDAERGGTAPAPSVRVPRASAPSAPTPFAAAVISPIVRRYAREHGIDLSTVTGSGPDGLILRADVEGAVAGRLQPRTTRTDRSSVTALSKAARLAAATFTRSRRDIPDVTCWVDADATALLAARDTLNRDDRLPRIGLLPILGRICVAALNRYPELNSSVVTDQDGNVTGIRRHGGIHLGFATQTERGLVVPVVHDTQALSTSDLATELTRLSRASREGSILPAELTGGTFTLNNYGVFGVDGSTPIIKPPEAAMLGIGRITTKPWVYQGELAARQVTQLSFTFDHRVCDGAVAGAFLRFVADAVEDPTALLRHL